MTSQELTFKHQIQDRTLISLGRTTDTGTSLTPDRAPPRHPGEAMQTGLSPRHELREPFLHEEVGGHHVSSRDDVGEDAQLSIAVAPHVHCRSSLREGDRVRPVRPARTVALSRRRRIDPEVAVHQEGAPREELASVNVDEFNLLCAGFWTALQAYRANGTPMSKIPLNMKSIINSHFIGAAVLISFGCVIGRMSAVQMVVMVWIEVLVAAACLSAMTDLKVSDPGGAITVHVFGGAFVLALAASMGDAAKREAEAEGDTTVVEHVPQTTAERGTVAMVGTIFLWIYWPSFNAAFLVGTAQVRAVINTVLSISASCAGAFCASRAIRGGRRFDMLHVANSTVAGGVIMGAACGAITNPGASVACGLVAGIVSSYSFTHFQPRLGE